MAGNASDIITAAADANPDGIALVHAGSSITWATLDARVTAFARGALSRGLRASFEAWRGGESSARELERIVSDELVAGGVAEIEYVAVADPRSLEPLDTVMPLEAGVPRAVVLIAARVGGTRLIDNLLLE